MSRLAYDDLEIVGFDGSVLVECELVLPVVRVKNDDDRFFKFESTSANSINESGIDPESITFYDRREIESVAEHGGITLLPKPFPAFHHAVIAYANREFLELAHAGAPGFLWQDLSEDVVVMAGPEKEVEQVLNEWATRIMDETTLVLEQFLVTEEKQLYKKAEHWTDLALCAATGDTLRARLYLRAGLAITFSETPERLDNLYRTSIKAQFKDWSWDGFQERLLRLGDVLRVRARYHPTADPADKSPGSHRKEHSDDHEVKELIEWSAVTMRIVDSKERYAEASDNASRYLERDYVKELLTEDKVIRVGRLIGNGRLLRLDNDVLVPLRGDPLIYFLGEDVLSPSQGNSNGNKRPMLVNSVYIQEARNLQDQNLNPGKVASTAVEICRRNAAVAMQLA